MPCNSLWIIFFQCCEEDTRRSSVKEREVHSLRMSLLFIEFQVPSSSVIPRQIGCLRSRQVTQSVGEFLLCLFLRFLLITRTDPFVLSFRLRRQKAHMPSSKGHSKRGK